MRRTFFPVVLVGLVSSALMAYGGHQPMLRVSAEDLRTFELAPLPGQDEVSFLLAGALALVALACWGVLLVVRGRLRQVVAAGAALASLGVTAVLVVGRFVQDEQAAADVAAELGSGLLLADRLSLAATGWFWVTLVASVAAAAASATAVRAAASWPEMGSRYDAPAAQEPADLTGPPEDRTSLDLWRSMDDGEDPTVR